ncbi:MAG: MOSC domain-containing protein [Solirubrobacteraceae bacterium]|nr:MOSC domain-containing protein [Solirubrobacteraceae bacterium]
MASVLSVNVGLPKVIGVRRGEEVLSGIDKRPVDGRLAIRGTSFEGDGQASLDLHGGPDMAIYAYAAEDSAWWAQQLGREITPGMFGENLTTSGVDCSGAVIGERWALGEVVLEVCQPRLPCYKLGMHFQDPTILKQFTQASRPGAYLRVVQEGTVGAGDTVEVLSRPDHGVTIALVADALQLDHALAAQALQAPELPAGPAAKLRQWA